MTVIREPVTTDNSPLLLISHVRSSPHTPCLFTELVIILHIIHDTRDYVNVQGIQNGIDHVHRTLRQHVVYWVCQRGVPLFDCLQFDKVLQSYALNDSHYVTYQRVPF